MDIAAGKGMTTAQSDEHQRRWTEKGWNNAVEKRNYDPSREHLNFEIVKGGIVQQIDKSKSIREKMAENLKSRGIKDPNDVFPEYHGKYRTVANFQFGGDRERMREIAFGDQLINWEKGKDNSHIERKPDIEKWAKDIYDFVAKKYGEENIAAFYVHLDETNPHIHCTLIPVADGKISFKKVFHGEDVYQFSKNMTQLHDELAEVNKKWGLERGDDITKTGAKHRTTEEYLRWLSAELTAGEKTVDECREQLRSVWGEINVANRKLKSFGTMISNLESQRAALTSDIEKLEQTLKSGQGEYNELISQRAELYRKREEVERKLEDKQAKLAETERQFRELTEMKEQIYREIGHMKGQLESVKDDVAKNRTDLSLLAVDRVSSPLLDEIANEFRQIRGNMSWQEQQAFEDTTLKDFAERGHEMIICAAFLYMGMVAEAISFSAKNGGGGGGISNSLAWGRRKDEDDREWAARCAREAREMMKPASRRRGRGR